MGKIHAVNRIKQWLNLSQLQLLLGKLPSPSKVIGSKLPSATDPVSIGLFFLFLTAILLLSMPPWPDEAQYWIWSNELDLAYYSKPGGIAWQIALMRYITTPLLQLTESAIALFKQDAHFSFELGYREQVALRVGSVLVTSWGLYFFARACRALLNIYDALSSASADSVSKVVESGRDRRKERVRALTYAVALSPALFALRIAATTDVGMFAASFAAYAYFFEGLSYRLQSSSIEESPEIEQNLGIDDRALGHSSHLSYLKSHSIAKKHEQSSLGLICAVAIGVNYKWAMIWTVIFIGLTSYLCNRCLHQCALTPIEHENGHENRQENSTRSIHTLPQKVFDLPATLKRVLKLSVDDTLSHARYRLKNQVSHSLLLGLLIGTLPALIWNAQHDWVTFKHVAMHNMGVLRLEESTLHEVVQGVPSAVQSRLRLFSDTLLDSVKDLFSSTEYVHKGALRALEFWGAQLLFMGVALPLSIVSMIRVGCTDSPAALIEKVMGRICFSALLLILVLSFCKRLQANWFFALYPYIFFYALVLWESRPHLRLNGLLKFSAFFLASLLSLLLIVSSCELRNRWGVLPYRFNAFRQACGYDTLITKLKMCGVDFKRDALLTDKYQTVATLNYWIEASRSQSVEEVARSEQSHTMSSAYLDKSAQDRGSMPYFFNLYERRHNHFSQRILPSLSDFPSQQGFFIQVEQASKRVDHHELKRRLEKYFADVEFIERVAIYVSKQTDSMQNGAAVREHKNAWIFKVRNDHQKRPYTPCQF